MNYKEANHKGGLPMRFWWQVSLSGLVCVALLLGTVAATAQARTAPQAVIANGENQPIDAKIDIVPAAPIVGDSIFITVGGDWSTGCIPKILTHSLVGNTIVLDIVPPDPSMPCGQVITPWSLTAELGQLPQAQYHIKTQGAISLSATMTITGHQIFLPTVSRN